MPPATLELVTSAVRAAVAAEGPGVTGLSCLADGADQIFARVVLEAGGALEAVVPAENYASVLPTDTHASYASLLDRASTVHRMPAAIASDRPLRAGLPGSGGPVRGGRISLATKNDADPLVAEHPIEVTVGFADRLIPGHPASACSS
jgi:hypothetical protein